MSKISNLTLLDGQKLMDLALCELNKRIDKLEKKGWKGSFTFKFTTKHPWDENVNRDYKVTVKFEDRGYKAVMGYKKGDVISDNIIIFMNTYYMSNKQTVLDVYVHEITHISQEFNKFLDWASNEHNNKYHKDIVLKKKKSKVSYRKYRLNNHEAHLAEHEAVLSTVLHQLKEDKIDIAKEYLLRRPDYFQFTWKDFVKKAYSYGVKKENILSVRSLIIEYFDADIAKTKKGSKYDWEYLQRGLVKKTPLMMMFSLGDKYWKFVYDEGQELFRNNPETFFKPESYFKSIKEKMNMLSIN